MSEAKAGVETQGLDIEAPSTAGGKVSEGLVKTQGLEIEAPSTAGGKVSEGLVETLAREAAESPEAGESASGTGATGLPLGQVTLTGDDDVLTAIFKETGIEIVSRVQGKDEAHDEDGGKKTRGVVERKQREELTAKTEDHSKSTDQPEQTSSHSAADGSNEMKTDGLGGDQLGKPKVPHEDEAILTAREAEHDTHGRKEDNDLDQVLESENDRLHRSDPKEADSPFVFATSESQSDTSTERQPPPAKPQEPLKKPPSPPAHLPNKTRSQNLSTESLQLTSRIPRATTHLGRSVSMVSPRVSSPVSVPSKGDKTPTKRAAQKIPPLIHAQRRPGGVLKRSVSAQVLRKKCTEMAEGMTLVLAVPVTHTTQLVARSSGEAKQPFIISPYQEEHVLAATCPRSGITRHIKIIL